MTGIEAHIRVKDDASPAFQRIGKAVNAILSKLGAVYTSTGKISQAANNVANTESRITKEVSLTGKQLANINAYSERIKTSELKRKHTILDIIKLGDLDAQQKQRIQSLLGRHELITKSIALTQAKNVERARQVREMEAKLFELRTSGKAELQQIEKIEERIRTVNAEINYHTERVNNSKLTQKKLESDIIKFGNADVETTRKRASLIQSINSRLANEEVLRQNILGIVQQELDKEQQAIQKQEAAEQRAFDKAMSNLQKEVQAKVQAIQKQEQAAIAAAEKEGAARWKAFDDAQEGMRKLILASEKVSQKELANLGKRLQKVVQGTVKEIEERNKAAENEENVQLRMRTAASKTLDSYLESIRRRQAAEEKASQTALANEGKRLQAVLQGTVKNIQGNYKVLQTVEAINKAEWEKNVLASQAANKANDEAQAIAKVEQELEESLAAQRQLADSIDWSNAGQVKQLELVNKITDERAKIVRYTNQLATIQSRINTLERQGKANSLAMGAAKAQYLQKSRQIANAQAKILSYERQSKTAINQNTVAQNKFNNALGIGRERSSALLNTLKSMMGIYIGYHSVGNIIKTADALTSARARIDLLNKGAYTTEQVMRKIYESAQRSRGSYLEMADVVSKMAMRAPSIFTGGIDEVIAFTETINKMAVVSGTATTELNSAILQITQALGAGVMRGDEFKSVVENLPVANQAVADYLGVVVDKITEMAHDGEITAGIFKNGILAAAVEISRKAGTMKWTWGQVWNVFKNTALDAFDSVLGKISAIANSDRFTSFMNIVGHAMYSIADACARAFDRIVSFGAWLFDNWKTIKPVIVGVSTAFATFLGILMIGNIVAAIAQKRYKMLQARIAMQAGATLGATVNQWGLNAALAACPTFAFIAAITTLIAVIGAITLATIDWDKANIDVGKTIRNVFGKIGSFLREKVLVAFDWIKTKCEEIGNSIIENWSKIAPVVNGVVAVIAAFVGVLMLLALWKGIVMIATTLWAGAMIAFTVIKGIATVATTLYALATGKAAICETAAAAATWFANLALMAKIALIVLIIVAIAWLVKKILEWCGVNVSVIGIICGAFMWLGALIANIFIGIWNICYGVVQWIEKAWTWCCDNIGTMWDNLKIWWDNLWLDAYAGLCNFVAKALNKLASLASTIQPLADLFDIDLSGISKVANKVSAEGSKTRSSKKEYKKLTEFKPNVNWEHTEYFGLTDAWNTGKDFGDDLTEKINKLGDKVKDFDASKLGDWVAKKDPSDKASKQSDIAKALTGGFGDPASGGVPKHVGDIAKNTGDTADNTKSLKDEDAEFLRQIAEMEAINRYTLTDLKVEMNNSNSISSNMDIDDVMKQFGRALYKAVKNNVEAALP